MNLFIRAHCIENMSFISVFRINSLKFFFSFIAALKFGVHTSCFLGDLIISGVLEVLRNNAKLEGNIWEFSVSRKRPVKFVVKSNVDFLCFVRFPSPDRHSPSLFMSFCSVFLRSIVMSHLCKALLLWFRGRSDWSITETPSSSLLFRRWLNAGEYSHWWMQMKFSFEDHLPKHQLDDLIYAMLWTSADWSPYIFLGSGLSSGLLLGYISAK